MDGKIIKWKDLLDYVGHSRKVVDKWIVMYGFPRPKYEWIEGRTCSTWQENEVAAWIEKHKELTKGRPTGREFQGVGRIQGRK